MEVKRVSEVPQPKNRGVESAGKGLNPQWNSKLYRENPFWKLVEEKRSGKERKA